MPKYEVAYYYNEHEEWEPVSYRELFSDERRAELREKGLRDRADGNYQLGIRNHPKTPHFLRKNLYAMMLIQMLLKVMLITNDKT